MRALHISIDRAAGHCGHRQGRHARAIGRPAGCWRVDQGQRRQHRDSWPGASDGAKERPVVRTAGRALALLAGERDAEDFPHVVRRLFGGPRRRQQRTSLVEQCMATAAGTKCTQIYVSSDLPQKGTHMPTFG